MGRENDSPSPDRRLAALAERQHGVVAVDELRTIGIGEHGIYERVRTGRLLRLHRGVYAVGHKRLTSEGNRLAAVLACGPGAVLSHQSAASLWEIRASAAGVLHVTVPSQNGRIRRAGIRVHRSRRLDRGDVTTKDGIPVTTLSRTLLDLADVLPRQQLKRAIDEAENQRLLDMTALIAVVDSNPGRRGQTVLRLAADPPHLTHEGLEELLRDFVSEHGLDDPQTNVSILGYEVDAFWPEAGLGVELDSWKYHGTRQRFQDDRERDRRFVAAGLRPVRVTALDLRRGRFFARELRALLRASAAQ